MGESIAAQALAAHGYVIVEQNWRCPEGEIDLVTRDGDVWAFVEVKTRISEKFGSPEEAVTNPKQSKMLKAALAYLSEHDLSAAPWRIDVVAIQLAPSHRVRRLNIYKNAVEG